MENGRLITFVKQYLRFKYWAFGSVTLSVLLVFIYLSHVVPQYRVSTNVRITETSGLPEGRFNELTLSLKSRTSVQHAIEQLSLQTLYTQRRGFSTAGLYGDSLPVEIVFDGEYSATSDACFKVSITGDNSLSIEDNQQKSTLAFDQYVDKPYGRFKIIKGPSYQSNKKPVNVDLIAKGHLITQYWQNLVIIPGNQDRKTITFSVLDITTDRGFDFIDRIIGNYNEKALVANGISGRTNTQIDDSITIISTQLSALKVKRALLQIKDRAAINPVPGNRTKKLSFNDQQQLNIYDVIAPYLKVSVNQFGLVPYSEEIQDIAIRNLVERYNQIQTLKQSKLRDVKASDPVIIDFNKQLSSLQKNLVTAIDLRKADIKTGVQLVPAEKSLFTSVIKDSIKLMERAILSKNKIYDALKSKVHRATNNRPVLPRLVVDQKIKHRQPEYPQYWLTYFFAIILGLILPMFIPYLIPHLKNIFPGKIKSDTDLIKIAGVPYFTSLKDLIPFFLGSLNTQSILLTSAADNLQKAPVIIAIADELSSQGKNVIVIDLNFREPGLLSAFEIQDKKGIINFLKNDITEIEKLIIPSKTNKNLYFIGAGEAVTENADPVSSFFINNELTIPWEDENQLDKVVNDPRIGLLLLKLRSRFDYILFACPSVIHPADLFPLAGFSEIQVILIGNNTTKKQLASIEHIYQRKRFEKPVIFNLS